MKLLSKEDWIGRRLVVDKFRDRRVFICGDACHLWVPYAGYGMNAGIADATNLSWLLAAHLDGWADEAILDSYQAERLPITEQVSHFAMNHALAMNKARKEIPREIEADGAEGERVRAAIGKATYDLNVQQYCCAGLNFGYYYQAHRSSPMTATLLRPTAWASLTSSTVPGARVPHLWLALAARYMTRSAILLHCCALIRRWMSRRLTDGSQGRAHAAHRAGRAPPDRVDAYRQLCCWRVPISMLHGAATPCPRILAHSLKCCVAPAPEPRAWPPECNDPVDEASLDEAPLLREITPAAAG